MTVENVPKIHFKSWILIVYLYTLYFLLYIKLMLGQIFLFLALNWSRFFCCWFIWLLIMSLQGEAVIHYNKLQADPKQGKSLDIGICSTRHMGIWWVKSTDLWTNFICCEFTILKWSWFYGGLCHTQAINAWNTGVHSFFPIKSEILSFHAHRKHWLMELKIFWQAVLPF